MSEQSVAPGIADRVMNLERAHKSVTDLITDLPELSTNVTPEDDVDLDDLRQSLFVVADFLSNPVVQRTYTHAPPNFRGRQAVNDGFLNGIESSAANIRRYLVAQEALDLLSWESDSLRRNLSQALDRSERRQFAFLTVPEQVELDEFAVSIRGRLQGLYDHADLRSVAKRAREAADSAEDSASRASSAAGVTADSAMSVFYEELGNDEESTANLFRRWAIGLGSVAGVMAWVFISGAGSGTRWLEIEPGDYVHLIQRVLVLASFLALAGYLSRQAHQHRTMGNWARSLAVQLKTFDAFVDAIDDSAVRDDLRREFASRVFGDHPAVKGEPSISTSSQGLSALTEALAKLVPGGK